MDLFAERGVAAVTVREIAAAAGVSPGLVMHHFGSKDGLKDAVDRRVAEDMEEMLAQLGTAQGQPEHWTLAAVIADLFEVRPSLAGYMRRLLIDGGAAADSLFKRLFETTLRGLAALTAAGVISRSLDEDTRAAFLLANDLALLLLRPQIERVTGVDPLSRDGLRRWTSEVMNVYTSGVFVSRPPALEHGPTLDRTDRTR